MKCITMSSAGVGAGVLPWRSRRAALKVQAVATPASPFGIRVPGANGAVALPILPTPAPTAPAPQPITVNVPSPIPGSLAPTAVYEAMATAGGKKAGMSVAKTFISGVLAGCFIGIGGLLTCSFQAGISGFAPGMIKWMGAMLFPVGLMMVILTGSELYTGNTAILSMAVAEKKTNLGGLMHNWVWSYVGNFVGSLLIVAAAAASGIMDGNMIPVKVAEMKSSLPLAQAFVRGVLANALVCMAVWSATAATSVTGKIMALWLPVMTFVTIGLEHSVANMFFIPMGMALGAKVSVGQFLINNLLPVTLGNTVAGALCIAGIFAYMYGSLGKAPEPAAK